MKRGDLATVVLPGAHGKPRPALIVQHDAFEALPSVTVLPLTSDVRDLPTLRVDVAPGPVSGVRIRSQVQIDKVMTIPRAKLGERIGSIDAKTLGEVDSALARFLGLGQS